MREFAIRPSCQASPDASKTPGMSNVAATVGCRVRDLRRARGISQQVLAVEAGISVRWLAMVEQGRGNLRPRVARALAEALGVTTEALITGEGLATILAGEP